MAERSKTVTVGRSTSTVNYTVKKGTSDTKRRPRRDTANKRFHNRIHNSKSSGPMMLLMDPNMLTIKKIK